MQIFRQSNYKIEIFSQHSKIVILLPNRRLQRHVFVTCFCNPKIVFVTQRDCFCNHRERGEREKKWQPTVGYKNKVGVKSKPSAKSKAGVNEAAGFLGVTKTVQKITGYKNLKYIIIPKRVLKNWLQKQKRYTRAYASYFIVEKNISSPKISGYKNLIR